MRPAVRLQPLRDLDEPLTDLLERVADAGFEGVEIVGLKEPRLQPLAEALGRTGLEPVAAHATYDRIQAERPQVIRELRTVGCERVVIPGLHRAYFEAESEVARMATRLSALGGRLAADGRTLCYQNHDYEFRSLNGTDAYDVLVDRSGAGLSFELDVGAVVAAGRNPVTVLETLGDRVPLVRLDGEDALGDRVTFGEGELDACVRTGREADSEWLIYGDGDPGHAEASLQRGMELLSDLLW